MQKNFCMHNFVILISWGRQITSAFWFYIYINVNRKGGFFIMVSIIFCMIASILVFLICSIMYFRYINENILLSLTVISISSLILSGLQAIIVNAQLNYNVSYECIGYNILAIILYFVISIISIFYMIYECSIIKLKIMIMSQTEEFS